MSYETWQGKRYDDEQSVSSAALFTYESEHGLKYGVERMDIVFRYLKGYSNLPQILKNILGTMEMQREKLSHIRPNEYFKASEKQLNVFRDHFSRYENRSGLNDILINCTPQFAEPERKRQRAIDRVVFEDEFMSDGVLVTQELLRVRKELETLKKAVADNATFKVKQVAVIALDDADFVKWYCSTDEIDPSINYIKITKVSEAIVLHNEGFSSDITSTLSGLNHKQHKAIMEVFNPPQKRKVLNKFYN
jgi:hypothetical protein